MKNHTTTCFILMLLATPIPAKAATVYLSAAGGYLKGPGGSLSLFITDLARNVPLSLEAGAGYYYQEDPGDASAARRIFINDNAGGEIVKHGHLRRFFVNLHYRISLQKNSSWHFYGGLRFVDYGAYFGFMGDNEAFTVANRLWGAGGGIAIDIRTGAKSILSIKGGIEYYFASRFDGHGQFSYDPSGVDDNPRNSYTYEDADAAVNQPRIVPSLTIALKWRM